MSKIHKILVTGSSGTIGTRLCEKLMEQGYNVIGVDWQPNQWLPDVNKRTIQIDLRDQEALKRGLSTDIDLVVHLAANSRVYHLTLNPQLAKDNFNTLFNTLEFARANNIKRFIFASSREVYGNTNLDIYREDCAYIKNCEGPYTASKIAGEALVHSYQQCYGIDFIIFRFSNVYGMYDSISRSNPLLVRVIPKFIAQSKTGQDLSIFGRDKFYDFTYIDDAISGISSTIKRFENAKNEVINLAYGQGTLIRDVAQIIRDSLQSNSQIKIEANRNGEIMKYVADISRARRLLDFNPQVDIKQGLQKTIEWYNKNPKNY